MMAEKVIYYEVIPGISVRVGKWDRAGKEMKRGYNIKSSSMLGDFGWILQGALETL